MKKMVLLVAVALMGCGLANAQQRGGGRPQMSVEDQVKNLKKELNLTDDQTQKVTALYTDFEKKMKEAGQGSREQMRAQREKLNQQVEALLTDEQKKVFQEKQAQRRGPGKGQGKKQ